MGFAERGTTDQGPDGDRAGLPRNGGALNARHAADEEGQTTFSTWAYSSSTGVARPKIETATLRRERASSTSSTTPLKEAKGPSATRTVSPTSKTSADFGRSTPSANLALDALRLMIGDRQGLGLVGAKEAGHLWGILIR